MNYLGKNDNEASQNGEERGEVTESDALSKRVVDKDRKVCSIDALESFHATKENDKGICNLASNEVPDTLENGKAADTADVEKISNGCKSKCDSTCNNAGWTSDELAEDVEGKEWECSGKTLLLDDSSDENGSFSNIFWKTKNEAGNLRSDVKLEDPLFTSKEDAPHKSSAELTEIGSDLSCERSTLDVENGLPLQVGTAATGLSLEIDRTVLKSDSSENEAKDYQTTKELDSTISSEYFDCSMVPEGTASNVDGIMLEHASPFDPHALVAGENKKHFGNSHSMGVDDDSSLSSHFGSNRSTDCAVSDNFLYACTKEINSSTYGEIATEDSPLTAIPSERRIDNKVFLDIESANSSKHSETMDVDSCQGPSFLDESSNITNSSLNSIITQNMFDEEEKYEIEDKAEAEKSRKKVDESKF